MRIRARERGSTVTLPHVSELEFLGAVHVELLRHRELDPDHHEHELFQTSTVQALLAGAYDGDVTIAEVLEHGDLGVGTLNGIDGELIVLDGEAWQARLDCTLTRPDPASLTPYAVVVPFTPGPPAALRGPFPAAELERHLGDRIGGVRGRLARPVAIRVDGRFDTVRVRSVPKHAPPYPPLADVIARQQITDLHDVAGTMVGFCFPDQLDGIEMIGWHLHLVTGDRSRGGHVLGYTMREGSALVDDLTALHVELPPAVAVPHHGSALDQGLLDRLEADR